MADQIVITEKIIQAKDLRAAVGRLFASVLHAEGHVQFGRSLINVLTDPRGPVP